MGAALLASAVGVVALDQVSKELVARGFAERAELTFAGIGIRRLTNTRGGVVALSRRAALALWLAVAGSLVVALAVGPALSLPTALGLGLVVGGSAGNLVDRFMRAGVLDFVALGPWPPFNVADVALVSGAALAYWCVL